LNKDKVELNHRLEEVQILYDKTLKELEGRGLIINKDLGK